MNTFHLENRSISILVYFVSLIVLSSCKSSENDITKLRLDKLEAEIKAIRLELEVKKQKGFHDKQNKNDSFIANSSDDFDEKDVNEYVLKHRAIQDKLSRSEQLAWTPKYKKLAAKINNDATTYLYFRMLSKRMKKKEMLPKLKEAIAKFPKGQWTNYSYGYAVAIRCGDDIEGARSSLSIANTSDFPLQMNIKSLLKQLLATQVALEKAKKLNWKLIKSPGANEFFSVKSGRLVYRHRLSSGTIYKLGLFDVEVVDKIFPLSKSGHPIGCGVKINATLKSRNIENSASSISIGLSIPNKRPKQRFLSYYSNDRDTLSAFFHVVDVVEATSILVKF